MTLSKTLCFCYLGLLYTGDQLLLSDLLRFVKEDRIPFRKAFTCLPPSMKLQNADKAYFRKNTVPDMHKISLWCAKLIEFLNLPRFKHRPLLPVISRFIKDLNLPDDLVSVVKVLVYKTEKQESEWYEVKKRTK
ncbi:TATA box-binding protein-associated factor RNA polymerase I subunit B, partial [Stegodyphus mimosarum]